jgi:hypothetical protein
MTLLHGCRSYQEVFTTFSSFGFVWSDREFRMARMKATYIYDHYLSTPEALSKVHSFDPLSTQA